MLLPFCDNRHLYKWDRSKCTKPLTKTLTCSERSQKIVHTLLVAAKKTPKGHFCSRILFSTNQPASFSGVVSQNCWVIGQKFWVAGINMGKAMSFLIAQGFKDIGQFWTEWTQKLRACLLRWERPNVGVWHLSFFPDVFTFLARRNFVLEPSKKMQQKYLASWGLRNSQYEGVVAS